MTTSKYAHPRALVEGLEGDQLRHLAADLAMQLAALQIALDNKISRGCVSEDVDLDAMRQRAAQIIVESIAWGNAS